MAELSLPDAPPRRLALYPGETVADGARKAIAFGVESMTLNQAAAAGGDVEALHQLRVASRRLRASIELFAGVIYTAQLKTYRRDIAWILNQAGAVRECDVTAALLKDRAMKVEPELQESIAPLLAALDAQRNAQHLVLCEALGSKRFHSFTAKMARPGIKKVSGARTLGAASSQLVRAIARGAMRFGAELENHAPAAAFHKLRVRIKRLRYALDMLKALGGKRHRRTLARLEELQESLGHYHDLTVASAWLHQFAETSASPPRTILAAGALIQSLGRREAKLRRRCIKIWRRFERSDAIRDTLEEIRDAGRLASIPVASPDPGSDSDAQQSQSSSNELNGHTDSVHAANGSHPATDIAP